MNMFELIDLVGCQNIKVFATESSQRVVKVVEDLRTVELPNARTNTCSRSYQVLKDGNSLYYEDRDTAIHKDSDRFNFVDENLDFLPSRYPFL